MMYNALCAFSNANGRHAMSPPSFVRWSAECSLQCEVWSLKCKVWSVHHTSYDDKCGVEHPPTRWHIWITTYRYPGYYPRYPFLMICSFQCFDHFGSRQFLHFCVIFAVHYPNAAAHGDTLPQAAVGNYTFHVLQCVAFRIAHCKFLHCTLFTLQNVHFHLSLS